MSVAVTAKREEHPVAEDVQGLGYARAQEKGFTARKRASAL